MLMLPSKPPDSYQTYPNKSQTQLRPPPSPPFSQKRPPPTGCNTACPTAMCHKTQLGFTFNFAAVIKGEASLIHVNLRLLSSVCLSLRKMKNLTILGVWWLQLVLKKAGADNVETTFLFSDTQLKKEKFLEDINNILNTGEVRKDCKCVLNCK